MTLRVGSRSIGGTLAYGEQEVNIEREPR